MVVAHPGDRSDRERLIFLINEQKYLERFPQKPYRFYTARLSFDILPVDNRPFE